MVKFYLLIVCAAIIYGTRVEAQRDDHDLRYHSDQHGRLFARYNPYSNTEYEHAIDDERCEGRPPIETVTRRTQYGNVHGRRMSLCDKPDLQRRLGRPFPYGVQYLVEVYLGIPYAKPPTRKNDLQFKPPQEPENFVEMDASKYKPACPQNERYLQKGKGINNTEEDCLYLNVFVPGEKIERHVKERFAVMMHIHSGNWDHGSAALFPPHMLVATQDVIVVTFNYRLGHLGFLATSDRSSPGNYGMLDQVQALNWVYNNIAYFNGNPDQITLFGSGSGAASAALLAVSPMSRRRVKRVIAQNGSPVADWAAISDPLFMHNTSEILGEELGCSTQEYFRLVDCIGKRTNNEIKILKLKPRIGWLPWGPVIDNFTRNIGNQFLPKSPEEMLEKGILFNDGFRYMTGVNRDQGVSIFLKNYINYKDLQMTEEKFTQKIKDFMKMYNYSVNAQGIFDAINFMYRPPIDPHNETLLRQEYIHLLTDRYYVAPLDKAVRLMLKNRITTFSYILNYTLDGFTLPLEDIVSSEVEYLLLSGAPFMDPKFYPSVLNLVNARWSQEDRNMSLFMMTAWANFAKDGNPTPKRLFNTILWEPVTEENFIYLNLNATNTTSTMIHNYREKECRFWNEFLPFFIDREPPTLAPTLEPGVEELRIVTGALWGTVTLAALLLTITLVCCILYCRIRRYDSY